MGSEEIDNHVFQSEDDDQKITKIEIDYSRDVDEGSASGFMAKFAKARDYPFKYLAKHIKYTYIALYLILFILYNAFWIGCIIRYTTKGLEFEWCDGLGFLTILTIITYIGLIYYQLFIPHFGDYLGKNVVDPLAEIVGNLYSKWYISASTYVAILAGLIAFVVIDSNGENDRIISMGGVAILILIGYIFSAHPGNVRWRSVFWGIGIEIVFGLLVLRWETGRQIFACVGDRVSTFLSYADKGSTFVFGYLVTGQPFNPNPNENLTGINETASEISEIFNSQGYLSGIFMFKTLSVIYFFSFCVSMLFYMGALQWVVMKMGWLLSVTVGTTAAESLNAAANVFLGQTEAPLLIKPFLALTTKSELHAVMTGGFATIAGTVLAAYINFGINPALVISASVMAAPTALAVSKLFYPETEKSITSIDEIKLEKGQEVNILDAAAQGASTAVMLVLNISASLVAFLSFIALLNGVIGWAGDLAGVRVGENSESLSFEYLLGKLFVPLAYIMGVPSVDCEKVARLIGLKTIVNEFAAYQRLGELIKNKQIGARAEAIATFALCGFSNPGSIGVQLGGLGALAPTRRADMAEIAVRAWIAACLSNFLSACIAGTIIPTMVV